MVDPRDINSAQPLSRAVTSNQSGPHEKLTDIVRKHLTSPYERPIADHSRATFAALDGRVCEAGRPVILDAGCGTGDSTRQLAARHPDHLVIGLDKSKSRITRERREAQPETMILARADLVDLWRLIGGADWPISHHFILYPNPWPKTAQFGRRWHGHPVFSDILKVGERLELRTNWRIYAEEFSQACALADREKPEVQNITETAKTDPLTPFEAKYTQSGQQVWECSIARPSDASHR